MGLELIILFILLLLGAFILLGYIGRKKRKQNRDLDEDKHGRTERMR